MKNIREPFSTALPTWEKKHLELEYEKLKELEMG